MHPVRGLHLDSNALKDYLLPLFILPFYERKPQNPTGLGRLLVHAAVMSSSNRDEALWRGIEEDCHPSNE